MQRLEWILALIAALLGGLHVGLTALLYPRASIEALWFAGTGLDIVAVAAMNIVALRAGDRSSPILLLAANTAMACFFAAAWPLLNAPQVAVGFMLFTGLTLCGALKLPRRSR